jgi:RecA/RadA recombinase
MTTKKAAKKVAKKKEPAEVLTMEEIFEKQLAGFGLAGAMRLADAYDNNYEVISSGWPGVDRLISDDAALQGIPKQVHIEVFSEVEHAGKTSFTLAIGVKWQYLGLKVGVVDIEPSITLAYLKQLGFITTKAEAEAKSKELGRTIYAVRLLQPQIKADACETEMVYVDKVLDVVSIASNLFDLLIIDSVDALVSEADSIKTTTEADMMGGVSKQIKSFMRKNTKNRATILYVNHMSQGLGQYAKAYTTGGKAIPRYSTLRFKIDRVEMIVPVKGQDPIGFVSKITMIKNRLGPIGRSTLLYYIFGEGFSVNYDYFLTALKLGVITKKGGWHYFGPDADNSLLTVNGEHNMYLALRDDHPELMADVKAIIDGVDAEPAIEEEVSEEDLLAGMDAVDEEEDVEPAAAAA